MATLPVITVSAFYPQSKSDNGVQNVSVELRKLVTAAEQGNIKSLSNLSTRRMGDDRIIGARDKTLVVHMVLTQEAIDTLGITEGCDINKLGMDDFYDIRETYSFELTGIQEGTLPDGTLYFQRGGLDQEGNVQIAPVTNPREGASYIPVANGKPVYRNTQLLINSTGEFPSSDPKPKYDRNEDGTPAGIAAFDGKMTVEKGGKSRKTAEYQAFLNEVYNTAVSVAVAA